MAAGRRRHIAGGRSGPRLSWLPRYIALSPHGAGDVSSCSEATGRRRRNWRTRRLGARLSDPDNGSQCNEGNTPVARRMAQGQRESPHATAASELARHARRTVSRGLCSDSGRTVGRSYRAAQRPERSRIPSVNDPHRAYGTRRAHADCSAPMFDRGGETAATDDAGVDECLPHIDHDPPQSRHHHEAHPHERPEVSRPGRDRCRRRPDGGRRCGGSGFESLKAINATKRRIVRRICP